MRFSRSSFVVLLVHAALVSAATAWPSSNPAYDAIEDLYTVTSGLGASGFSDTINPCNHEPNSAGGLPTKGRLTAGEWSRIAFHDSASHDRATGTGGVDASIQFELARPQNIGDGQISSLRAFAPHYNVHRTLSDLIALGLVLGVKTCNGPSIPMRVGRIDAEGPGPETVPTPDQTLDSHTAAFARMGFNTTDMISAVACGHSLGGVHHVDFPTIVEQDVVTADNPAGITKFEFSPPSRLLNNFVAVEWINGTMTNPLVIGKNDTENSDKRIFGMDGNKTMQNFANDIHGFGRACNYALGKLIDTVPSKVKLSDGIVPYPVKPQNIKFSFDVSGALKLTGYIRFFELALEINDVWVPTTLVPANMGVTVSWASLSSSTACSQCSTVAKWDASNTTFSMYGPIGLFAFTAPVDAKTGISALFVDYTKGFDGKDGRADNAGKGSFPIQDKLFLYEQASCTTSKNTKLTFAIRKNAGAISSPAVSFSYFTDLTANGVTVNKVRTTPSLPLVVDFTAKIPSAYYTLYSVNLPYGKGKGASLTASATVGGQVVQTIVDLTRDVKLASCR